MDLDIKTGIGLITKALEEKHKKQAWDLYIAKYQHMNQENYISFEEFYNPKKEKEDKRTAEEIIKESEDLLLSLRKEANKNRKCGII